MGTCVTYTYVMGATYQKQMYGNSSDHDWLLTLCDDGLQLRQSGDPEGWCCLLDHRENMLAFCDWWQYPLNPLELADSSGRQYRLKVLVQGPEQWKMTMEYRTTPDSVAQYVRWESSPEQLQKIRHIVRALADSWDRHGWETTVEVYGTQWERSPLLAHEAPVSLRYHLLHPRETGK